MNYKISKGMTVIRKSAQRKQLPRTVIGILGRHVYMRVGDNPESVDSCPLEEFWVFWKRVQS